MQQDRGNHDVRRPVVHVSNQVRHGNRLDELHAGERLGQLLAGYRDLGSGWRVNQCEVDAGEYENAEADDRHFA